MSKIVTVNLPDIGEGVVEGEVIEWLKSVGDSLEQDEPVVVVMTDKATVELPSPHPGKLAKQYYQPGEIAILDKPLYDIELEKPLTDQEIRKNESPNKGSKEKQPLPEKTSHRQKEDKVLTTPPVRKLAKDLGIDINQITGTGKEGRVMVQDLKGTQTEPQPLCLSEDKEVPLIGIQGTMARKMTESKRTIAHFSYFESVDATRLIKLKEKVMKQGEQEGLHVTYMPFFIRALSLTLKAFPLINSSVDMSRQKLLIHQEHNIGIAMSTKIGLIVPVIKNVEKMDLSALIHAYHDLIAKAKRDQLKANDMHDSTITISNYGVLGKGGFWATPIINPPEVAILAVNKIQKQPVVKNDRVIPQDTLNLSWSFDHRVIDGDLAAKVSHHFSQLIQNPAQIL